jgi:HK97 family phage portal protein
MGVLARMVGAEKRFSVLENPAKDPALANLFGSNPATSGVSVSERTALNYSAVWAAVTVIAGDLSSVPLPLYRRRKDGGRERATAHPLYRLLRKPNPEMSSMTFRDTLHAHVLTWGNGYAEIERTNGGKPLALWPLTPDRVTPGRSRLTGQVLYRVTRERGPDDVLRADQMFHIAGLAFDGLVGYSPVRLAREAIGLGLATEKFGAAFFGNGAWAGLVLEHPETLSPDAHLRLKESWNEIHQGPTKAHKVTILEQGMKASKQLTFSPEDAQFLGTRAFQAVEIARWYNIAVHKLRDMTNAHFNNIEHEGISHVTSTLRPWGVRWEQEIDRKLLTEAEQEEFYAEHLFDALLRGDRASRDTANAVGRQWGWRSVNEVKRMENENPIGPEGDIYLVPSNMIPADKVKDVPLPGAQPPPAPDPPKKDPAPAPEPAPTPEPKRARLIAAMRGIFIEALGRKVRKEALWARRVAGRGADAFRIEAEEFYGKHRAEIAEAAVPSLRAHLVACGASGDEAETRADAVAAECVARSRQAFAEVLETKPKADDLRDCVDRLVSRWEIARPGEMADLVFAEENER